jgi:hypothetical protein
VGFDAGQRQQDERDQAGAVASGAAVEQDAAGWCLGQRGDRGRDAVGPALRNGRK